MSEALRKHFNELCAKLEIPVLDSVEYERIRMGPICPIYHYVVNEDDVSAPPNFDKQLSDFAGEDRAIFLCIKADAVNENTRKTYRVKFIVFPPGVHRKTTSS